MLSHAALVCGKYGSGYLFLTKSCCYSSMPTTQLYHKTNMPLQQKPTSSNAVSGCRRSAAFGHQPLSSDSSLKDVSPDPSSFLSLRAYPMALVVKGGKELTAKHRNTVRGLPIDDCALLTRRCLAPFLLRHHSLSRRNHSPHRRFCRQHTRHSFSAALRSCRTPSRREVPRLDK
jgi:hypothetical protein